MAGGANSVEGPEGDSILNPFDFILMMEGAVVFTAHVTRRLGLSESSRAAAPFVVNAHGSGYASAADEDESARGEQWMPLWSQPTNLEELKRLLAEGRAQIGAKTAREPLDLARAIARLGTVQGIKAFQRYGYIERNGQSNLAVPLGRFFTMGRVSPLVACIDDLDPWMRRLRSVARPGRAEEKRRVPSRLRSAERSLCDALFAVTQHTDEPGRWQTVLRAIADVEGVLVTSGGIRAGPAPRLRPDWIKAADDGSPELRLAVACALQARSFLGKEHNPDHTVRKHWLPLKENRFSTTSSGGQTKLHVGPEVVLNGRSGLLDSIALVERRLIEAGQSGERRIPMVAAYRADAHPTDLAALISGEVDLDRTSALARALMAIDGRAWARNQCPARPPNEYRYPDEAWLVIRLAMLPWRIEEGLSIGCDPAIFRRLVGGDAATAVELALRRLNAAGIRTAVRASIVSPETARLWAAALAFPITRHTARRFLKRLDPKEENKS